MDPKEYIFFFNFLSIPTLYSSKQPILPGLQCSKGQLWNQCIGEIDFVSLAY